MKGFAVTRTTGVELLVPYSAEFIDQLKRAVSSDYRSWSPATKSWFIESGCSNQAVRLARLHFGEVERLYDEFSRPVRLVEHATSDCLASVRRAYPDHTALHILPGAPADVLHGAYRSLAVRHHPDRGGSHEAMVRLNLAFERLEEAGR